MNCNSGKVDLIREGLCTRNDFCTGGNLKISLGDLNHSTEKAISCLETSESKHGLFLENNLVIWMGKEGLRTQYKLEPSFFKDFNLLFLNYWHVRLGVPFARDMSLVWSSDLENQLPADSLVVVVEKSVLTLLRAVASKTFLCSSHGHFDNMIIVYSKTISEKKTRCNVDGSLFVRFLEF